MNIGPRPNLDPDSVNFYNMYYDKVRTPDFNESTRILKPTHGIRKIGAASHKKCRFCGKDETEVKFKKIAHAFPECIGNKALETNYECDSCNDFFGRNIENDYAIFFTFFHSIMQISGKKGVPDCSFKIPCELRTDECMEYCVQITKQDGIPCIKKCMHVTDKYLKMDSNKAVISQPVGKCSRIAVFKTLVKMALTVMPIEELPLFQNTIDWLLEKEHRNFYKQGHLLVRFRRIPGFNVVEYPEFVLYKRKITEWNVPYMLFSLTYGCYSLLIEVPKNEEDNNDDVFSRIPFTPLKYFHDYENIWDMSSDELVKGFIHTIVLNFQKAEECTDQFYVDENKKIQRKANDTKE